MKAILPSSIGNDLRAVCHKFGEPFRSQKKSLVELALQGRFTQASALLAFHDALLFIRAYPENKSEYELAGAALLSIEKQLSEDFEKGRALPGKLNGSGLAGTTQLFAPSIDLLEIFTELFPGQISIDSTNADSETVTAVLKLLLPQTTHEYLEEKNKTLAQRAHELAPDENPVEWLLRLFRNKKLPQDITDQIFGSLGLYVSLPMSAETITKSRLESPVTDPHFNPEGLQKSVDAEKILNQKIKGPKKLSPAHQFWYTAVSRIKLALLNRETDPVTYLNPDDFNFYEMGRGFSIALFGLKHERRLPFDSYVGYMAFKNDLPIAYGGAWMFGHSAKIGLNIFEEFRGGESAWIFCQLMRLYRQLYEVKRFIVEPYQYGKHNPEGIHSGAFWFYYRLGYRPADEKLNALAAEEWNNIQSDKSYRSPVSVLKAFTHSNIELAIGKKVPRAIDPSSFSGQVAKLYAALGSNADTIIRNEMSKWLGLRLKNLKAEEQKAFHQLAPLFYLIPDRINWNTAEKKKLAAIVKARAGKTEMQYCRLVSAHAGLLAALSLIAGNKP